MRGSSTASRPRTSRGRRPRRHATIRSRAAIGGPLAARSRPTARAAPASTHRSRPAARAARVKAARPIAVGSCGRNIRVTTGTDSSSQGASHRARAGVQAAAVSTTRTALSTRATTVATLRGMAPSGAKGMTSGNG